MQGCCRLGVVAARVVRDRAIPGFTGTLFFLSSFSPVKKHLVERSSHLSVPCLADRLLDRDRHATLSRISGNFLFF